MTDARDDELTAAARDALGHKISILLRGLFGDLDLERARGDADALAAEVVLIAAARNDKWEATGLADYRRMVMAGATYREAAVATLRKHEACDFYFEAVPIVAADVRRRLRAAARESEKNGGRDDEAAKALAP